MTAVSPAAAAETAAGPNEGAAPRRLALVASKGTLDQAYPPLILATTAASLGWEVGIYFTFYGLDILHKDRFEKLKVAPLANPSGPIQLPNLLGALPGATKAATRVMQKWMGDSKMPSVPEFIEISRGSRGHVLRLRHHDGGDGRGGGGPHRRVRRGGSSRVPGLRRRRRRSDVHLSGQLAWR